MGCVSSYLCLVHSDQALVDFGPGGDSADVPQLIGMLSKRTSFHLGEGRESVCVWGGNIEREGGRGEKEKGGEREIYV